MFQIHFFIFFYGFWGSLPISWMIYSLFFFLILLLILFVPPILSPGFYIIGSFSRELSMDFSSNFGLSGCLLGSGNSIYSNITPIPFCSSSNFLSNSFYSYYFFYSSSLATYSLLYYSCLAIYSYFHFLSISSMYSSSYYFFNLRSFSY